MPAPLAWAVSGPSPPASETSRPPASRTHRWSGSPRAKAASPSGRARAPRPAIPRDDLVHRQRHADHAGGGDRDPALGRAGDHRRRALHLGGVVEPGRPVAALALPELTTTARNAPSRSARVQSSTGAASAPERGEAGGAGGLGRVAHHQPDVGRAAGLDPGRRRRRPKAAGRPSRSNSRRGRARSTHGWRRRLTDALPLGPPEHQVEVLHRLRGRALPQVVDGREHDHAAGAVVAVNGDPADVGLAHVADTRWGGELDERLVRVSSR